MGGKKTTIRFLTIGIPVAAAIGAAVWTFSNRPEKHSGPVKIQLAYPITSLDPSYSKDWETVLINNHIYPRLIPTQHESRAPHITEHVDFVCLKPANKVLTDDCKEVQISFTPRPFKDCMQREVTISDLRAEFETLVKKAPWLLPKMQRCDDGAERICVSGVYRPDVQRRMHSVSFRFGWSKAKKDDSLNGAGPYCLTQKAKTQQGITEGALTPNHDYQELPEIHFLVSQDPAYEFNFALYGSKKLLRGKRLNIQAHTPIGYYVVTNPALAGKTVPWNLEETKNKINDVFLREEVFFSAGTNINNIFPAGSAVTRGDSNSHAAKPLEFVLPDYLPACQELAAGFNETWKKYGKVTAVCKDVVSFVYEHVWNPKRDWDGFIVGVTQHDPGRNTVEYEYFSPDSPESWVYDYPNPKAQYYLAGVGQSIVTVDGERFCELRPNLFGLGDIFISDLLGCKQGWFGN